MTDTLVDDLETLKEALDGVTDAATTPKREFNWRYSPRYPHNGPQYRERPDGPQRLAHTYTDPLYIAQWALQRVLDQLALKGNPKLGAVAEAALARAEEQATQIIKDAEARAKMMESVAGAAAVRTRQKAKEEAAKEARRIIDRARAAAIAIEDEVERRVNDRFNRMYGRRAVLKRRKLHPGSFRLVHDPIKKSKG